MSGPRPLPRPVRRLLVALGGLVGLLAWALGVRRRVALDNLARAFPRREPAARRALARAAYWHLGRAAAEFLLLGRVPRAELEGLLVREGTEALDAALAGGKGAIVCAGHLGNFEVLAAAHALRGVPLTVITRRLGRWRVNEVWRGARAAAGVRELTARRGATLGPALAALARGEALGYVFDQHHPRRNAVFPSFFGVPAATSPTPALLALRTGAPVFFAATHPLPDGRHRVVLEGPLPVPRTGDRARDVLAFMQDLNDRLEGQVRQHPEHWLWLHRRWKGPPDRGERTPLPPAPPPVLAAPAPASANADGQAPGAALREDA